MKGGCCREIGDRWLKLNCAEQVLARPYALARFELTGAEGGPL